MIIPSMSAVAFLYIVIRLLIPLSINWKLKLAIGFILLLASQEYFLIRNYLGGFISPRLPILIILIANWVFIALLFLFLLLLLKDIVTFSLWLIRFTGLHAKLPFSPMQWAVGLGIAALILSAYGMWQAIRIPDVNTMEISLPKLPKELDGLRLIQVSDSHISALLGETRVRGMVDKINAMNPDLILLTGDIVDGTPDRRAKEVASLKDLQSKYGVYACAGNHEYYSDFPSWAKVFPGLGITILSNQHKVIKIKGIPLVIAGVADVAARNYNLPGPNIHQALAGAPKNSLRILLDHRPGRSRANSWAGVDLQLSGHTHGGQIIGIHWLVARYNKGFISGWKGIGKMQLYISPGAGLWSGFPVRLGISSEIALIILRTDNKIKSVQTN